MATLQTKPSREDVASFLSALSDPSRHQDCVTLLALMQEIMDTEPKLWAGSIIGFGEQHYTYASGHQGDTFLVGFASRKQALTLYGLSGFKQETELLDKLGKYTTGKGCLYIKHRDDVDLPTLRQLIQQSAHSRSLQSDRDNA